MIQRIAIGAACGVRDWNAIASPSVVEVCVRQGKTENPSSCVKGHLIRRPGVKAATTRISLPTRAGAAINSFYEAGVVEFVADDPHAVVGALTTRAALEYRGSQPEQALAWQGQIELLREGFNNLKGS